MNSETPMYKCPFCKKSYSSPNKAVECFQNHNIVFLMIPQGELVALTRFIQSGDFSLLTDSLRDLILSYSSHIKSSEK